MQHTDYPVRTQPREDTLLGRSTNTRTHARKGGLETGRSHTTRSFVSPTLPRAKLARSFTRRRPCARAGQEELAFLPLVVIARTAQRCCRCREEAARALRAALPSSVLHFAPRCWRGLLLYFSAIFIPRSSSVLLLLLLYIQTQSSLAADDGTDAKKTVSEHARSTATTTSVTRCVYVQST